MDQRPENRGKRQLAPIFAKKPRTALFAHPNNHNSSSSSFSSGFSGIQQSNQPKMSMFPTKQANMPYTQYNYQNPQQNINERMGQLQYFPTPSYGQTTSHQTNPSSSHQSTNNYEQNWGQRQPQRQQVDTYKRTWSERNFSEINRPSSVQSPYSRNTIPNTEMPSWDFLPGQTPGIERQCNLYPSLNEPSYGGGAGQNMGPTSTSGPTLGQQPYGEAYTPSGLSSRCTSQTTPTPNKVIPQKEVNVTQTGVKRKEAEMSLRILSATVQGMIHWSQNKKSATLMFELIGRINSAVSTAPSTSKEFMLNDDKNTSVKCIFYEIDRPCPRLIRGQYYRCVGTYNNKTHIMNCVNIRPATDTEKKLHPVFVSSSDKVMRAFTKP